MSHKTLSPLEQDAMNAVWELQSCAVRDVMEKLNHDKKLAYTTVATVLQRLLEKGFVSKNSDSLIASYAPIVTKEMYGKKMANSFVKNFLASFGETAMASFADSIDTLPKEKKDYLLQLLEKQHENK